MTHPAFAPGISFEPYWWEAAPPVELAPVELPALVDVAVVGAGYTGLSAALALARAGRRVLVLEREDAGRGSSSRNQGQIGALFKRSYASLTAAYGPARAANVYREGQAAVEFTKDFIGREQIRCGLERSGRFVAAYRRRDYEALARELEALRRAVGYEADMVPRAEQHREVGSDVFFGGQVRHKDASLHGALYQKGLLERALAAGATIAARTEATAVARERSGFTLGTAKGAVSARHVLVATNAQTGPLTPWLRRRVIPIGAYGIATEPLPPELIRRVVPAMRPINDTRKLIFSIRPSPDHTRLIFGGRASLAGRDLARTGARLFEVMAREFPALEGVRVTHSWMGHVAFTFQFLPHIGAVDGLHYVAGCCGSGIALMTYLGHKAALRIMGSAEGATAFDDLPFETRPLYHGAPWFLPPAYLYYRVIDGLPR